MRTCLTLVLGLAAAAACSNSRSEAPLLASATIGPEGGTMTVTSGKQTGLVVTFPPGALAAVTEVRIRDATPPPVVDTGAVVLAPPNQPFSFEPVGLRLEERATLRAPYATTRVVGTAPGNVRALETRNGIPIEYVPDVVDIAGGYVELPIRYLSKYQVVRGPTATQGVASYLPPIGSTVPLEGGISLTAEAVPDWSPFAGPTALRWRITRTPLFGPPPMEMLYFDDGKVRGREALLEDWRERWSVPFAPWNKLESSQEEQAVTMPMVVESPIGSLGTNSQLNVFGAWSWTAPVRIGSQQFLDVMQLQLSLAWNRWDIGVGQKDLRFLFAPGLGFLGFVDDGVQHLRIIQ